MIFNIPSGDEWFDVELEATGMERMLLFAYQQSSLAVIIIFVGVKFVWNLEQMRENGKFYTPTCRVYHYHNYCSIIHSGHESNSIRESTIQCNCVSETPPLLLGSISRKQIDRSGSKFGDFQSIVCIQYIPNLSQISLMVPEILPSIIIYFYFRRPCPINF